MFTTVPSPILSKKFCYFWRSHQNRVHYFDLCDFSFEDPYLLVFSYFPNVVKEYWFDDRTETYAVPEGTDRRTVHWRQVSRKFWGPTSIYEGRDTVFSWVGFRREGC